MGSEQLGNALTKAGEGLMQFALVRDQRDRDDLKELRAQAREELRHKHNLDYASKQNEYAVDRQKTEIDATERLWKKRFDASAASDKRGQWLEADNRLQTRIDEFKNPILSAMSELDTSVNENNEANNEADYLEYQRLQGLLGDTILSMVQRHVHSTQHAFGEKITSADQLGEIYSRYVGPELGYAAARDDYKALQGGRSLLDLAGEATAQNPDDEAKLRLDAEGTKKTTNKTTKEPAETNVLDTSVSTGSRYGVLGDLAYKAGGLLGEHVINPMLEVGASAGRIPIKTPGQRASERDAARETPAGTNRADRDPVLLDNATRGP